MCWMPNSAIFAGPDCVRRDGPECNIVLSLGSRGERADRSAEAHAHHAAAKIDTTVPFDSLIWIHVRPSNVRCQVPGVKQDTHHGADAVQMMVQAAIWAISFPLGMVLGLSK